MISTNLLFPKTLPRTEAVRKRRTLQRRAARQSPAEKSRAADIALRWYYKNPEKVREKRVAYLYGMSKEEYQKLLAAQGGVCAICKGAETQTHPRHKTRKHLSVDHVHGTGAIRGLLCSACNTAIGLLKDDPALLNSAIAYLARVA